MPCIGPGEARQDEKSDCCMHCLIVKTFEARAEEFIANPAPMLVEVVNGLAEGIAGNVSATGRQNNIAEIIECLPILVEDIVSERFSKDATYAEETIRHAAKSPRGGGGSMRPLSWQYLTPERAERAMARGDRGMAMGSARIAEILKLMHPFLSIFRVDKAVCVDQALAGAVMMVEAVAVLAVKSGALKSKRDALDMAHMSLELLTRAADLNEAEAPRKSGSK